MELTAGKGTVESLWIKLRGKQVTQMSSWESATDLLCRTMTLTNFSLSIFDAFKSTACVLMGDFYLPEINW